MILYRTLSDGHDRRTDRQRNTDVYMNIQKQVNKTRRWRLFVNGSYPPIVGPPTAASRSATTTRTVVTMRTYYNRRLKMRAGASSFFYTSCRISHRPTNYTFFYSIKKSSSINISRSMVSPAGFRTIDNYEYYY